MMAFVFIGGSRKFSQGSKEVEALQASNAVGNAEMERYPPPQPIRGSVECQL